MSDGDFDTRRGKEEADDNAWKNRREQTLKKYPALWEKYGPEDEDDDEQ